MTRPRSKYAIVSGVKQHIAVAEAALGKKLPRGAVVHHIDGDSANNSRDNLVILQNNTEHLLLHTRARLHSLGAKLGVTYPCSVCKVVKPWASFSNIKTRKYVNISGVCRECYNARANANAKLRRRVSRAAMRCEKRKCLWCGAEFSPVYKAQKCCSVSHRNNAAQYKHRGKPTPYQRSLDNDSCT